MTALEIVIILALPLLFLASEIFLNRLARRSGQDIGNAGEN